MRSYLKEKKEKSSHIPNKDSHLSSQKERTQSPTVNRRCSLLASPNSRLLSCLLWGYFAHFFFVLKNCVGVFLLLFCTGTNEFIC